jgi:hypothetical protein
LKKITFAALLLVGLYVVGSPMALAQNTSSQLTAPDITADTIANQQLALLRRDSLCPEARQHLRVYPPTIAGSLSTAIESRRGIFCVS